MLEFLATLSLPFLAKIGMPRWQVVARAAAAVPGAGLLPFRRYWARRNLSREALDLLIRSSNSGRVHKPPGLQGRLVIRELERAGYIEWIQPIMFMLGDEIPYWITDSGDLKVARELRKRHAA